MQLAVLREPFRYGDAVFRDNDRKAVALGERLRPVIQALGRDRPAHIRIRRVHLGRDVADAALSVRHDVLAVIDVEADEVGIALDDLHIRGVVSEVRAERFGEVFGILPEDRRIGEERIVEEVIAAEHEILAQHKLLIRIGDGHENIGRNGEPYPDFALCIFADGARCKPVGFERVVPCRERLFGRIHHEGRVLRLVQPAADKALRLVDRDKILYAVGKQLCDVGGVFLEPLGRIGIQPAALQKQLIGILPVKDGEVGLDARVDEFVDELVIELYAFGIEFARAVRHETGPRDGKAVCLEPHLFHDGDVLAETVIMIAPHLCRVAVEHEMSVLAGGIPYRSALPAFVCGAFDLVGGSRRPPDEIFFKTHSFLLRRPLRSRRRSHRRARSDSSPRRPAGAEHNPRSSPPSNRNRRRGCSPAPPVPP